MGLRLVLLFLFATACACRLGAASDSPEIAAARAQLAAGDVPGATAALTPLAAVPATRAAASHLLGVIALRSDQIEAAVHWLEQAAAADATDAEMLLDLGSAYGGMAQRASLFAKLGWAKKCRLAFERAVALAPDEPRYRLALIEYYREAPAIAGGGLDKAVAQAAEIQKRDPVMGAQAHAGILASQQRWPEAAAKFEEVLRAQPDAYYPLYGLGRLAAISGESLDRGEQALRRCLELTPAPAEPSHSHVYRRLGDILRHRGEQDAARAAYTQAVTLDPTNASAASALKALE